MSEEMKYLDVDEDLLNILIRHAKEGDPEAQNNLGWLYENGWGVKQDYAEAMKWFVKSAEKGYARAENNIGFLYQKARGVEENFVEAMAWYRKAAAKGEAYSLYNMGVLYKNGQGVDKDLVEAYKWIYLAGQQGLKHAPMVLEKMKEEVTPVQIEEAKKKAGEWRPKEGKK